MIIIALLLFSVGLVLLWIATRRRKASGLPGGRVIYTDTHGWGPVEKPFYDPGLNLTGKPDYLIEKSDRLIPVEIKSSQAPEAPYDSHIFQLAAYCYLTEIVYKKRPPYGIIKYANRTYAVDYTLELESAFKSLVAEIRQKEFQKEVARSHENTKRCQRCGYRSICNQKLGSESATGF